MSDSMWWRRKVVTRTGAEPEVPAEPEVAAKAPVAVEAEVAAKAPATEPEPDREPDDYIQAVPIRGRFEAPAKLTLSLRVVGVRADGYHLLDAEMVTVDLMDTLVFAPGDGLSIGGIRTVGEGQMLPTGPDNLINRALAAVGRQARVALIKRIPAGAGLGGGSTDAAAVLRWAGCGDLAQAAALGADVAFCLAGGRARVTGVGEVVEALPFEDVEFRAYTLLTPPFGVSTQAVYQKWDELGGPHGPGLNDLELAALAVEPRLAGWRDQLADATGQVPVLAGSGSTWWVEGAYPGGGRVVVRPAWPK